jgi:hypothetical protein
MPEPTTCNFLQTLLETKSYAGSENHSPHCSTKIKPLEHSTVKEKHYADNETTPHIRKKEPFWYQVS